MDTVRILPGFVNPLPPPTSSLTKNHNLAMRMPKDDEPILTWIIWNWKRGEGVTRIVRMHGQRFSKDTIMKIYHFEEKHPYETFVQFYPFLSPDFTAKQDILEITFNGTGEFEIYPLTPPYGIKEDPRWWK